MESSSELAIPLLRSSNDVENKFTHEKDNLSDVVTDIPTKRKWGNQTVLAVTCGAFALFVVAEIIGALASGSLSLLSDAAAMSVDVFTYFTNMVAERIKSKTGGIIDRNNRILLEVIIPLFSVTALIGVTIFVTVDAIRIIINPNYNDGSGDVNVYFLYGFSVANAIVDLTSTYMFYQRGKDIFYHEFPHEEDSKTEVIVTEKENEVEDGVVQDSLTQKLIKPKKNVNMMSAFTHVGGDSLRTMSVFVAALVSTATSISSSLCDAWAAAVVTVTIIAIVIPLLYEIWKSAKVLLFS